MRIASVNCSPSVYNLACAKIGNYHRERGDQVYEGGWAPLVMDEMVTSQIDKFYFSVIFSWEIQELIRQVNMVRSWGKEVEIGGPAATFMANYIERRTGVAVHRGLDDRFERVPGDYELTFSSRGCPHKCRFCGVKRVEPVAIEYDDFPLAHRVGDNNLTATSWDHQKLVVERFKDFAGKLDFNSGFDIRFFEEKHYELYSQLKLESAPRGKHWRFAFDTMAVEKDVRRVAAMMRGHGLDRHQVMFYVLIGFPGQTPKECLYRLNTIIELGMNLYPMRFWPLNSLKRDYVAPGWTEDLLQRMTTYYQVPFLWMSDSFENFKLGKNVISIPAEQAALNMLSAGECA